MGMTGRVLLAIAVATGVAAWSPSRAYGEGDLVDLLLRAHPPTLVPGRVVEVRLHAVSKVEDTKFSVLKVILNWDPNALQLLEAVNNGDHFWNAFFGFYGDAELDGLNNSLLDGDALFEAGSFFATTATAKEMKVATFRFMALQNSSATGVTIIPSFGTYAVTYVLQPGAIDVTGSFTPITLSIVSEASMEALDLTMPADRIADIVVSGRISARNTYGLTTLVELSPRPGAIGEVVFSAAPPTDIVQLGDPWPVRGSFEPWDTDVTTSSMLNAALADNETFVAQPVTFSGPLAGFPVHTGSDARGVWDIRLCTGGCGPDDAASFWWDSPDPVRTALGHGALTVVALGDGDASATIDLRDFAQFQRCFTGVTGPANPPDYPVAGSLPCSVYDFDADGDVDGMDVGMFGEAWFTTP